MDRTVAATSTRWWSDFIPPRVSTPRGKRPEPALPRRLPVKVDAAARSFQHPRRCGKLEIHGSHAYVSVDAGQVCRCPGRRGSDPLTLPVS